MNLENLPSWQTMTATEIVGYLKETEWRPTNALITLGQLRESLESIPDAYAIVRLTLEAATVPKNETPTAMMAAAEMADALAALRSTGLSISAPDRQMTIDHLAAAGGWPDEVRDAVKSLGGIGVPRWQTEGYSAEPTREQVQAEIDLATLNQSKQDWRQRFDAVLNQVGTAEIEKGVEDLAAMAFEMSGK